MLSETRALNAKFNDADSESMRNYSINGVSMDR